MLHAMNCQPQTPAHACAAGMFSFHNKSRKRHAYLVCLLLLTFALNLFLLLGTLDLAAVLVGLVLLSLVLLIMGGTEVVRIRMG